jgi:hypothetical protein
MKRIIFSLILVLAGAVPALAQQRPLLTDDIDTVPVGAVRIGAGVDFIQNAKFPLSGLKGDLTRVGNINVSVGLAPNVSFEVEGVLQNFLAVNSATPNPPIPLNISANSSNDVGDFTVSTKIKLKNETKNTPAIGFKFSAQIPSTDQSRGIGTNQINVFGRMIVGKKFGKVNGQTKFNLFGNLGLGIMTAPLERFTQNDVVLYGLAGIYRVNKRFNVVSEVNGRVNTRSGSAPLGTESQGELRLGTQIRASGLRFDAAGIIGLTKYSPRSGVVFGVTYESPSIFQPAK